MKKTLAPIAALLWVFFTAACELLAQDAHRHDKEESPFMHFLRDNGLYLQIGGGVVLVVAVAVFILMRRAKKLPGPESPAPSEAPK